MRVDEIMLVFEAQKRLQPYITTPETMKALIQQHWDCVDFEKTLVELSHVIIAGLDHHEKTCSGGKHG